MQCVLPILHQLYLRHNTDLPSSGNIKVISKCIAIGIARSRDPFLNCVSGSVSRYLFFDLSRSVLRYRNLRIAYKPANDANNDLGEGSTADGVLSDKGYSKEKLAERRKLMQDRKSNLTTEIISLIPEYISFDFVSRYLIILLLYVKETNFISR